MDAGGVLRSARLGANQVSPSHAAMRGMPTTACVRTWDEGAKGQLIRATSRSLTLEGCATCRSLGLATYRAADHLGLAPLIQATIRVLRSSAILVFGQSLRAPSLLTNRYQSRLPIRGSIPFLAS